ncbi:MAG: N-succinylarginine dihydrolase [Candidatus Protochlamydia sp.]|nr:N-succinylarginine dihydrolase [Candidatus Protochlamydia sp.]
MQDDAEEYNFDGLIGPTHNFSGLSYGNMASIENKDKSSNPKKAALQGLAKMYRLACLGVKQAVLPPQERPFIPLLRALGYTGPDIQILEEVSRSFPWLFQACSSSSSMWAANAATAIPSSDVKDRRVHFTPANLITNFHRSFEPLATSLVLRKIFDHPAHFMHHHPLPPHLDFADEGAANHIRFASGYGQKGVHLFVYGKSGREETSPKKFPARQSEEASKAIVRLHQLHPNRIILAQQNSEAIDAGVFHNDVISTGNLNVFFYHEKAFANMEKIIQEISNKLEAEQIEPVFLPVSGFDISLEEAVSSYLFNSQLVTLPDGKMILIAPQECQESARVQTFLQALLKKGGHPVTEIIYQDLRESMQNGGGPACLRLRVVLNQKEQAAMLPTVLLTDLLYQRLVAWVETHYRESLTLKDLADPELLKETRAALDALTDILKLGPIYPFQLERLR